MSGGPPVEVRPGRDRFVALARSHRMVPVWCELVADTLTPVGTFLRVAGDEPGFLLESVEGGERWGRYSFVGRRPLGWVSSRGGALRTTGAAEGVAATRPGILALVEALLATYPAPDLEGLPPLHGGLVGYLGYDVVREIERLPTPPPDDRNLPDAVLAVIGQLCVFDHWRQRVVLVHNVLVPEGGDEAAAAAYDAACTELSALTDVVGRPVEGPPFVLPVTDSRPSVTATLSSADFRRAVQVAKEHIGAGDIFQVVLSRRFDFDLGADAFDVYRILRLINPSPYLYFLRTPEATVVGASPEPMVRLRDGVVVSRPIAGSRPRGVDDDDDRRLAGELSEDPKEVAEHVMLVDLARNDVGRVATFGTVAVDELMVIERYSHIMHLTSQVTGRLKPGLGPVDVLRATLPAGTLSGAPKVRAMEIIDELEPTRRGVYGGVVGYIDFSGNLDTAIAIRTMVVAPDGRASVQAGAGIVADSDPEREDAEVGDKAAAVLAAVACAQSLSSGPAGGDGAGTGRRPPPAGSAATAPGGAADAGPGAAVRAVAGDGAPRQAAGT